MTKDEALKLARKYAVGGLEFDVEGLERFVNDVRADEREECAKVCKKHADVYAGLEQNPATQSAWAACIDNHDFIRARGNT